MKLALIATALMSAALIATPVYAQKDIGKNIEKRQQEEKNKAAATPQGKSPIKRKRMAKKQEAEKKAEPQKKPRIQRKKD